ncbi:MAG: phytoene desaturase family protein [Acidimicrobiales bacterium]
MTARPVLGKVEGSVTAAGRGRQVLVLESDGSPGGYAQCFHRYPCRFDCSLHALNGLAPGGGMDAIYRELGIWERVHLRRLDPLYVARFPDHGIVAHPDVYRYESDLIGQFPDEEVGIRAYLDEASAVCRATIRFYEDGVAGRPAVLEDFVTRYPTLVSVSGETWAQTITRHVDDPRLVAVLGALWPYTGLPPQLVASVNGSVMSMAYGHHGGWYPEGGSGAVAWALERELHARGGEVHYSQTAARVDVSDGRVTAVETAEGLKVEADVVISDASAPATMLEMVGRGHLPHELMYPLATTHSPSGRLHYPATGVRRVSRWRTTPEWTRAALPKVEVWSCSPRRWTGTTPMCGARVAISPATTRIRPI